MRTTLSQIGLATLGSADDLQRFANELSASGGFAAPVASAAVLAERSLSRLFLLSASA